MGAVTGRSYIVRHGPTPTSVRHIASGPPSRGTGLSAEGIGRCRDLRRSAPWPTTIESCTTSTFARTRQTAALLLEGSAVRPVPDRRIDEIDYGRFDGGPWMDYGRWLAEAGVSAIPRDAVESWLECSVRMLEGLSGLLETPATRLVVGHGMMLALLHQFARDEELDPMRLPEAGYLEPLVLADEELCTLLERGCARLAGFTAGAYGGRGLIVHG